MAAYDCFVELVSTTIRERIEPKKVSRMKICRKHERVQKIEMGNESGEGSKENERN